MIRSLHHNSALTLSIALVFLASISSFAAEPQPFPIDLQTTLRLARAQNLDVQIAQKRLDEAAANYDSTLAQFFPWISPGISTRRHEGQTQAVNGILSDVDKQSATLGITVNAQMDIGDVYFKSLASKQLANAASQGLSAQEQDAALNAAQAYFELLKVKALVDVMQEAVKISQDYTNQLHAGVDAGVAFKGDELRVQTQSERYQITLTQAREQQRIAAADLAQVLHLDPTVELIPTDRELLPITLVETNTDLQKLVQQALDARPELKQNKAQVEAAREAKNGAVYGPLIPTLGVQAFLGKLGGGPGGATGNYASSRDYYIGLSWRIGSGGIFDFSRLKATQARLDTAELNAAKTSDAIARQVVESHTRIRSLSEQIKASNRSLAAATETLQLTRGRKQLGVGIVLEDIQAQQELVRARTDYLRVIAEFNKTQYVLSKVLGSL